MAPPDFSSLGYWETRFLGGHEPSSGFEWLSTPSALQQLVLEWHSSLPATSSFPPKILHIGSGTSSLSNSLRTWLSPSIPPINILNVDYSPTAVVWGKAKEVEEFGEAQQEGEGMSWGVVDLLDPVQLQQVLATTSSASPWSLIIEKSTSDALSCGPLLDNGVVEPLTILARNLARIAPEGGTWLALSYSSDRFPKENLEGHWVVEKVVKVSARSGREGKEGEGETKVGVPVVEHGIYVLKRTGKVVEV